MIVIALSQDSLKFDVPPNMELGDVVGALQSLIDDLLSDDDEEDENEP